MEHCGREFREGDWKVHIMDSFMNRFFWEKYPDQNFSNHFLIVLHHLELNWFAFVIFYLAYFTLHEAVDTVLHNGKHIFQCFMIETMSDDGPLGDPVLILYKKYSFSVCFRGVFE